MFHFSIYKISYLEEVQRGIHWAPVTDEKDGQKLLGNLLGQHDFIRDRLFKTNSNGAVLKRYPVYVLKQENDVTLLQLHNSVLKTLIKQDKTSGDPTKYVAEDEESNPYCYVIIDNRKGVGQIAIEISSSWGDPDNVRDVLQASLTKMLQQLKEASLKVIITPKMRPTEIWAFVQERLAKGDTISRVVFGFLNRKKHEVTDMPKLTRRVENLLSFVESTGAKKGQLRLDSDSASPVEINRRNRDFQKIIQLCSSQGYTLSIHFKRFKAYRCNESVRAEFDMREILVSDFIQSAKEANLVDDAQIADNPTNQEGVYGIVRWLDFVRKQTKEYDNAEKVHKPRDNRHKK